MATWTYEINSDNSVTFSNGDFSSVTKSWSTGETFTAETAAIWAEANKEALNNPESEFLAGFSPAEPTVLRSSVEYVPPAYPVVDQAETLEIES